MKSYHGVKGGVSLNPIQYLENSKEISDLVQHGNGPLIVLRFYDWKFLVALLVMTHQITNNLRALDLKVKH